jgi:DNA polymerase III gamma/tau subunit
MTSSQDTYTQTLRSAQDAVVEAFRTWTDTAKGAWATAPGAATSGVDPQQVVEQVFDFAEKMLAVQREFAKSLAVTAASATEAARQQSESVVSAVRQQAEDTTKAVRGATKTNK